MIKIGDQTRINQQVLLPNISKYLEPIVRVHSRTHTYTHKFMHHRKNINKISRPSKYSMSKYQSRFFSSLQNFPYITYVRKVIMEKIDN